MLVYLSGFPVQPLAAGVMVIVAVIGADVAFVAVNDDISPDPLAASPMSVFLFVQVNVVPLTLELKLITAVEEALQILCAGGRITSGVGNTETS